MKNHKFLVGMLSAILICFVICISKVRNYYDEQVDITSVNEIVKAVEKNIGSEYLLEEKIFAYDFSVIQNEGTVVYSTLPTEHTGYGLFVNEAIRNHETVLYYSEGAVVIYTNEFMHTQKRDIITVLLITVVCVCFLLCAQSLYIRRRFTLPFRKLKSFADAISDGQLDLPLPMDQGNIFGAFTESFDLMRVKLKEAQEKAVFLEKQKNEMVASLSHDIKTPLSSIIAVSEMLMLLEQDQKKSMKIKGIETKAEEIDHLVTNLFQTTLEDLSELKVEPQCYSSELLIEMIEHADLLKHVTFLSQVPPCLISIDPLRMGQIFSNIISNAYKYADSPIEVHFLLNEKEDKMLTILIKDHGTTLNIQEVDKLGDKFFRGENAKGKQGCGLGLYNCRQLLDRMEGNLRFYQDTSGFSVKIYLKLI